MDFRLPGMDGVETTLALVHECPEVAVVCLTASASPRELDALLAAGAIDCLRKDEELDEIVSAIRGRARRSRSMNLTARTPRSCSTRPPTSRMRQIRFPNMRVVPLYVRFGEESFRDYVELDPHDFYARLRTAPELPTTSQPTPQDFLTVYHALAGYERIYSLHISAKLSGTFQSASLAAAEEGERIRLVDTESASVGIAMLALGIQELLARGTTDEEIEALVERYRERSGILFTVDTLEFLAKGGRIGRAQGARWGAC